MSEFYKDFKDASIRNTVNELYFKLATEANAKHYDYYCVVEGKTDEGFYCHVNHPFFKGNKNIYLSQHSQESNDDPKVKCLVGKNAVVDTCKIALKSLKNEFKNCVFIVDHDYFGLEEFEHKYNKLCLDSITVLPVYSFENYFTLNINLQWIMKNYLPQVEHEAFIESFNDFCESLAYYCALKGIITKCHPNRTYEIKYTKGKEDSDIFIFDFHKDQYYKSELMYDEIDLMTKSISAYPELGDGIENLRIKLSKNKELLKGKILFNFVKFYLRHKKEIRALDSDSYEYGHVVSNLKVKIDVVINDNRIKGG